MFNYLLIKRILSFGFIIAWSVEAVVVALRGLNVRTVFICYGVRLKAGDTD